jgi:hypothetical protein
MNCFLELNSDYYCERVLYFQEEESLYPWTDYLSNPYVLLPDNCFKKKVSEMTNITSNEFEKLWQQKEENFIGMKTVIKLYNVPL